MDAGTVTSKVVVPIAKASANPIIRAVKAKGRRDALLRLLTRTVYAVERQRPSTGLDTSTGELAPGSHTDIAKRMLEVAASQLVKGRPLRKVGRLFGYSNPPDELADIPADDATRAVNGWATVALSEAWAKSGRSKGSRRTIESR